MRFMRNVVAAVLAAAVLSSWCCAALANDSDTAAKDEKTGVTTVEWLSSVFGFGSSDAEKAEKTVAEKLPEYLASGWDKLTDSLTGALELRDKQETLPDNAWFGADKSSNSARINKLLDEAVAILTQGSARDLRAEAFVIRETIPALHQKIDRLKNQRIRAAEDSKLPWRTTRAKIDAEIEDLKREIAAEEAELAAINTKLAEELRAFGLDLDQSQVDVLLSSVTGEDIIQNTVVFSNVKAVVEKLEELSRGGSDDLEINRRYTGMYLVLNDLLIYTQEGLASKIEKEYKPKLVDIIRNAQSLYDEAMKSSAQRTYTEEQRKGFKMNAEANALTVKVGRLYSELLDAQRKNLMDSISDLRRNRNLAENTYRTVKSSGDLRSLIRSGLSLFDTVHALKMPQLAMFGSDTMRAEFEEINKRLKVGGN